MSKNKIKNFQNVVCEAAQPCLRSQVKFTNWTFQSYVTKHQSKIYKSPNPPLNLKVVKQSRVCYRVTPVERFMKQHHQPI